MRTKNCSSALLSSAMGSFAVVSLHFKRLWSSIWSKMDWVLWHWRLAMERTMSAWSRLRMLGLEFQAKKAFRLSIPQIFQLPRCVFPYFRRKYCWTFVLPSSGSSRSCCLFMDIGHMLEMVSCMFIAFTCIWWGLNEFGFFFQDSQLLL